jgi:hypothetical protein
VNGRYRSVPRSLVPPADAYVAKAALLTAAGVGWVTRQSQISRRSRNLSQDENELDKYRDKSPDLGEDVLDTRVGDVANGTRAR